MSLLSRSPFFLLLLLLNLSKEIVADTETNTEKPPNIILFVADDLGWNDISSAGATDCFTPNIDRLMSSGVTLYHHYSQPMCSPTRAALMTGRYPFRYGFQHNSPMDMSIEAGLSLDEPLISEVLQDNNYDTYIVGKWHLGFYKWDYTPNYRGFNQFVGYYGNEIDYYEYTNIYDNYLGLDFRNNTKAYNATGLSSFEVYFQAIDAWMDEVQVSNKPFFWYIAHQSSHAPIETFDEYIEEIEKVRTYASDTRRDFCALVYGLDLTLGTVVSQLEENGLWDNTYLIFLSDNGPAAEYGSAYPLRGVKTTIFEGGIRGRAFVNGGLLPDSRRGEVLNSSVHVIDWFSTICSFANIDCGDYNVDGVDLIDYIIEGTEPDREYLILNVDLDECDASYNGNQICGAIRYKQWKLAIGNQIDGGSSYDYWDINKIDNPSIDYSLTTTNCNGIQPVVNTSTDCAALKTVCLFNIDEDPCEYNDLSSKYPEIVQQLIIQLQYYYDLQSVPLQLSSNYNNTGANPELYNGFWTPWRRSNVDGSTYVPKYPDGVSDEISANSEKNHFSMFVSILM